MKGKAATDAGRHLSVRVYQPLAGGGGGGGSGGCGDDDDDAAAASTNLLNAL